MSKKRTIMIIGASYEHCIGIQRAQDLGHNVLAVDGNPNSPGFDLANDYILASTYDPIKILEGANKYIRNGNRIDGVMTLASDVPYSVAYVSTHLNLPGIGLNSGLLASNKVLMKKCFKDHNVPSPRYKEIVTEEELKDIHETWEFPLVIKPTDSRGARGVQLVTDGSDLDRAYKCSRGYSIEKRVMIEEYLAGPQLSTEGFIIGGECFIPAIFDRNYEYLEKYAPFIVENGGEMPSRFSSQFEEEIKNVMCKAAEALGIKTGIIKGDLVINKGVVKVIEIAARMSGGFFGTVATPLSCGVDLISTNISIALGEKIEANSLISKNLQATAIRFAFPPQGEVTKISGQREVAKDKHCLYCRVFGEIGDIIEPITNHPSRPAVVVASGKDLKQAVLNADRLIEKLEWEIKK
jgi:biotin carboxylase